jgi:hypothetical protein
MRGDKAYRRRTLNTYYRTNSQDASPSPFKRKHRKSSPRKWLFGLADIILVCLLLAGLIYSLILRPQPKIQANDYSYHSSADYRAGIQPFFKAVKDNNKISFDEAAVVKSIEAKYPEVQNVRVELPFFSPEPTVWLYISKPAFKLSSGAKTYIVDSQGTIVAESKDLPQLTKLVSLNDQSGYPAAIGKPILSSSSVAFINTLSAQAKAAKVPIGQLALPPLALELDLRTQDQPYYVKFFMGGDALTQTGQFLAARQKFSKGQSPPSLYLDVRVNGKVFYK